MKRFIILVFIFLFTLTGVNIFSAGSMINNEAEGYSVTSSSARLTRTSSLYEEFIYIRVLVDGHWWTYVYTLDGSFIVAIPDEDE